ncbi:putative lipoprotein [Leptospira santarosai str. 2000030832]|nr:putative lipoprotein [Leptospira santarosai str. 2000030832]
MGHVVRRRMWELPHFLFGFVGCPENVRIPLLNLVKVCS